MKLLFFLFLFSSLLFPQITFEELDYIRSISSEKTESIIFNGTKNCNDYFENNKYSNESKKYKNFFMCKFSKKRNRFYIYMLAVENKQDTSLKEFCKEILNTRPEITDHMLDKYNFQKKPYLSGFYVDNFFNNKVLNFFKNKEQDELIIENEINNFILENKSNFTEDNIQNNKFVSDQINKINKIYNKFLNNTETDLDRIIKSQLDKIVRYKIFINDTKKFKSFSCNWKPGNGLDPYVKREKFKEFENI